MLTLVMLQWCAVQLPVLPPNFVTGAEDFLVCAQHKSADPDLPGPHQITLSFGRGSPLSRRQQLHYRQPRHGFA